MPTLKELCLAPESGPAFTPERLGGIEKALTEDHRAHMPWYLRGLVGIGAWLASIFFLVFAVMLIGDNGDHATTFAVLGAVLLVIAVVVGRQKWGLFVNQCAIAVSLAAQGMLYFGFVDEHQHPLGTATAMAIGLAVALYFAYPDYLSRLITCIAALQITMLWIYVGSDGDPFSETLRDPSELVGMVTLYWALQLACICWCFFRPCSSTVRLPLGHALLISLSAWQIENLSGLWIRSTVIDYNNPAVLWLMFYVRIILTAMTLFGVAVWAAGGLPVARANAPLFLGLALALGALVWLGAGGVLLALLFMLLGFSLQNGTILGLGLILFPVFLSGYYYNLHLDLLAKAGMLAGSGVVLLALRAGLQHLPWVGAKEAA